LIHRSSVLELEYQQKLKLLDEKIDKYDRLNITLQDHKSNVDKKLNDYKDNLSNQYKDAINEAKKAIKTTHTKEAHKLLNNAHNIKSKIQQQKVTEEILDLKVGQRVKYNSTKGVVLSIKGKKAFFQSDDGMKIQVPISTLKRSGNIPKIKVIKQVKLNISKPKSGHIKIDLHGQRADEAIANLDKFLSDCLLNGFEEVLVYHGIGTGKLAYAVRVFLDTYPCINSYADAPQHLGGFGAKVVKF
jgi:DNA mismatch repair protein MutS2